VRYEHQNKDACLQNRLSANGGASERRNFRENDASEEEDVFKGEKV
jgi:hypothetical protein